MSTIRSYSATGQDFESNPLLLAFDGSPAECRPSFRPGNCPKPRQRTVSGSTDLTSGVIREAPMDLPASTTTSMAAPSASIMRSPIIHGWFSFGYSRTDVDQHFGLADGDVKSWTGSVYGSYSWSNAYVGGAVSYGINNYSNSRYVTIGSMEREADSSYGGDAISAYVGGGYYFNVGGFHWVHSRPSITST